MTPLLAGYLGEVTIRTDEERLIAKQKADAEAEATDNAEVNSWRARGYKKKERTITPLF